MAIEKKLDRIISILERIEAKLYDQPIPDFVPEKEKPIKRVPMYKDPVLLAEGVKQIIKENNQKIERAIEKGKKGLPLTKHEETIYQVHLKKHKAGS